MSTDEQAIRNLVEQWHRATAAGDVDTVLRLMAEDVVFLMAGKPPMKGRSTFEQGLRGHSLRIASIQGAKSRKSRSRTIWRIAGLCSQLA